MYALDEEPEKGAGRWGRMGIGLAVAVCIAVAGVAGADSIVPSVRALQSVIQLSVVEEDIPLEPPKPEELPPPPPPETKPKPEQPKQPKVAQAPQPAAQPNPQPEASDQVGLDADSFGAGSGGGPAFAVGGTQMGVPGQRAGGPVTNAPVALPPRPKFVEAKPRGGNLALYPDRARRMGIQGLMVIETDIDETGRVTRAVVRSKLDPELDELVRKALLTWNFEPATINGQATKSTKFVRVRFQLQH